jgi:UTP--glucose-1-phosphate uridylyltransferase
MRPSESNFLPFAERMLAAGIPDIVIRTFKYYYRQLAEGRTGLIPEVEICAVESLPDAETLQPSLVEAGRAALRKTVLMKLNGGLGTSMGLERAKSLLLVKNGLTFLDVIARQALAADVPLVLMDSYNTRDDSLAVLRQYPGLWGQIPLSFLQHKVPKVIEADLSPARWTQEPELEWCPPGHGDIYPALVTSGMLELLLAKGYQSAFVSNADNLGAAIEPAILGYFVENRLPFLMEVTDRTAADRKGGHLARQGRPGNAPCSEGQFILREAAQCPAEDMDAFQDIARHRYFNTNNLWLNLLTLKELLAATDGVLGLPMIRNQKNVDPRDPDSPLVYQLETAMGAAISLFQGAGALRVPRTRFAPVKTTDDLLAVRSDAYVLTDDWRIVPNPGRRLEPPTVSLDPRYYRLIDDLDARFPYGPPSLAECERLTVRGDVRFGRDVSLRGAVEIANASERQAEIPDGAVIEGNLAF